MWQVTIVIPAYNAEKTIQKCITACQNQTIKPFEIIVVDDGSTDTTSRLAGELGVKCIRQEHRGPAAARNTGAKFSNSEVIAFTDADCLPNVDWIEKLLDALKGGAEVVGGTYGIANPASPLARIIHEEIRLRHENYQRGADFVGSYNMAIFRNVFLDVGGFDEEFKEASAEDNDLSYRLYEKGYKIQFVADAIVKHYHPEKLIPYLKTQFRHGFWRVRLYQKHSRRLWKGDSYAGVLDFISPPFALFTLVMIIISCFVSSINVFSVITQLSLGATAFCCVSYIFLKLPWIIKLYQRTHDGWMLTYGDMCFLRDLARVLGMIKGYFYFGFGRLV